jgi:hypothetical protein
MDQVNELFEAWHREKYGTATFDRQYNRFNAALITYAPEEIQRDFEAFEAGTTDLAARDERIKQLETNVAEAYGHLWHVNNEPLAPVPLYSPAKAAYEARKILRDSITHEQRGQGIANTQHVWGDVTNTAAHAIVDTPPLPSQPQDEVQRWPIRMPKALHRDTKALVSGFATALAEKLHAAEQKYGYSNGWDNPDWMDECRAKLREHLDKGDPRDVANYCAFLWYHGASTKQPVTTGAIVGEIVNARHAEAMRKLYPSTPSQERPQVSEAGDVETREILLRTARLMITLYRGAAYKLRQYNVPTPIAEVEWFRENEKYTRPWLLVASRLLKISGSDCPHPENDEWLSKLEAAADTALRQAGKGEGA